MKQVTKEEFFERIYKSQRNNHETIIRTNAEGIKEYVFSVFEPGRIVIAKSITIHNPLVEEKYYIDK